MPSLGSILSIAGSALRTQQEAIDVVAHNLANASTEGYSRQRPILSANSPLTTPSGVFGTGVGMESIQRIRDGMLDGTYRRESSLLGESQLRSGLLGQVEAVLSEPGEEGLSSALDAFFSAWSGMASDPTSSTARAWVRDQGQRLTEVMGGLSRDLSALREETESGLVTDVGRVNELADTIAELNRKIVVAEVGMETAGDLRDARDRAIDDLATLLPVQVLERESGSVAVVTSGLSLVDGSQVNELELRDLGGSYGVGLAGHAGLLPDHGGAIGAALRALNSDLPAVQAQLNDLAEAIVTDINAIHRTGTGPDGNTGVDFFDPAGLTASSLSLSTDVLASVDAICAGTAGPTGEYRAGANDLALALASLRGQDSGLLGMSFGEHFRRLTADIGFSVRSAREAAEVHETLVSQADARRVGFHGVSTDEELMRLMQFQTAYAAAARVVTTANEMMETLVRM